MWTEMQLDIHCSQWFTQTEEVIFELAFEGWIEVHRTKMFIDFSKVLKFILWDIVLSCKII